MTDLNTPPAASERMTAEEVANHRRSVLGNINNRKARGLGPGGYATELALLDTIQSLERELAEAKQYVANYAAQIDALSPQPGRAKASPDVEEISHKLGQWGEAYPVEQFPEPDKDEIAWLHRTKPGLCDNISGSMGRHAFKVWGWPALLMIRTLSARAEVAERELTTERTLREAAEWAVKNTKGERVIELEQRAEAAEARAEGARAVLEAIAEHPSANAIILPPRDGNPMIGAGTAAKDAIRALLTAPPPTAKEG